MKFLSFLCILLLLPYISFASKSYPIGAELFVLATSGLNMRGEPKVNSDKLQKIGYGEMVIVKTNTYPLIPFSTMEHGQFKLHDHWLKVKYNGIEGYVFAGYLSYLPAPELNPDSEENQEFLEGYLRYLEIQIGKNGETSKVAYFEYGTPKTPCSWTQPYNNGMSYSEDGCGEGGFHANWIFEESSFEEVYMLAIALFFEKGETVVHNPEKGVYEIGPEEQEAGCYYTISINDVGNPMISMYCGC